MKNKNIGDDDSDFNKGMVAYEHGDCETAIKLLKPYAQKGSVMAQNALGVFTIITLP